MYFLNVGAQRFLVAHFKTSIFQAIENAKIRLREGSVKDDSPLVDKFLNAMQENPGVMTEAELCFQLKTLFTAVCASASLHDKPLHSNTLLILE